MKKFPTKKELLKMPDRDWNDIEKEYDQILLVPGGSRHESGYMHIAVIGVFTQDDKTRYEIAAYPDDIECNFPIVDIYPDIKLIPVRMDCWYPQGVLQYHGDGKFKVSHAVSSVTISFYPNDRKVIHSWYLR